MSRRGAAILILVAWAGALGWLGWRETSRPAESLIRLAARRLAPGSAWFAVAVGDRQIGAAGLTVDTTTTGFTFTEVLSLDWQAETDAPGRLALRSDATLSRPFRVLRTTSSYTENGVPFFTELDAPADTVVRLRLGRVGNTRSGTGRPGAAAGLAAGEWSSIPAAFPFRMAAAGALSGAQPFSSATVDPTSGRFSVLSATPEPAGPFVVADSAVLDAESGAWSEVPTDTVETWWLLVEQAGIPWRLRVTELGWAVEAVWPFGVTWRRGPFELVQTAYRRERVAGEPGIPVAASRPFDAVTDRGPTRTVRAVLAGPAGAETDAMGMFRGGRQRVSGDTVLIAGPDGEGAPDPVPAVRYRNTGGWSATDARLLSQAVGVALQGHATAEDTVAALVRWVARDVRLDPAPDAPLAPGAVVAEGRAGPEGKARLLEALLREAGYPARMVAGVLLSNLALPYHTWVEVWRAGGAGRWEPVDPTAGAVPARTDLLRVMEGPARALTMMTVVGGLRATLLDPARAERP